MRRIIARHDGPVPASALLASPSVRLEAFDYDLPVEAIAQHPVEPRDDARLLVDRGPSTPPAHRHVRDLPELLAPGDLLVRQRLAGAPGPPAPAPPARAARSRSCCWRRWTTSTGAGSAWSVRPGAWPGARRSSAPTANRSSSSGPAREAGDTFTVELCGDDPARGCAGARRGAAAAVHHRPAGRSRALPDRVRRPARARPRRRRPACTSPPGCSRRWPTPASPRRGWSWWSGSTRSSRSPRRIRPATASTASATACRTRPWRPAGEARRVVAVGTTTARALESAAATGQRAGRTRLFIHRPYEWQVVDLLLTNFHLPRTTLLMMIDAFIGPRWRDLYARRARPGLPVPVLRRRHAAASARRDPSGPLRGRGRPTAPARAGTARTARGSYRTPCFMPVGTRGAIKHLSAADYDDLGRPDRAGQHLPPDAPAGGRGDRGPRWAAGASAAGTA